MNMFDLFRAHRLRRTPASGLGQVPAAFVQKLNLSAPTVFDNPPAINCRRPKVTALRDMRRVFNHCCCAKLD